MDFTLPFPFMFFAELITKAVKIKKRKCFLNSNDFENKNESNPCFNSHSEKRKKNIFPAQNSSYSHDHMMKAVSLFIIVTSTRYKYQTKILINA